MENHLGLAPSKAYLVCQVYPDCRERSLTWCPGHGVSVGQAFPSVKEPGLVQGERDLLGTFSCSRARQTWDLHQMRVCSKASISHVFRYPGEAGGGVSPMRGTYRTQEWSFCSSSQTPAWYLSANSGFQATLPPSPKCLGDEYFLIAL